MKGTKRLSVLESSADTNSFELSHCLTGIADGFLGRQNVLILISEQETLPNFFPSNQFERTPVKKDEKQLQIFSGTANSLMSKTQGQESIAGKPKQE
ncbi:hypothetical protein HanPSC8_Chr03g0089281 [Helianthus annuus]|nr:hypothetical protein HanPSC8_Chr03g0089281 [Helianthus annuus]